MSLGKQIRLKRIFSRPTFCSVAIDHFLGYSGGLPDGLRNIPVILEQIMAGEPDALTMFRGAAVRCWPPYAGTVPLIIQSSMARWDGLLNEQATEPEEVLRLGADAIAVAAMVHCPQEAEYLRRLEACIRKADPLGLPVILHVYPLTAGPDGQGVSFQAEHIEYAVRVGIELGADVIKVPYTGDPKTYGPIVQACPVPVVAAGGPKTANLKDSLELAAGVIASGARGLTIGRNIWGTPDPTKTLKAFKAVVHDGRSPEAAPKSSVLVGPNS